MLSRSAPFVTPTDDRGSDSIFRHRSSSRRGRGSCSPDVLIPPVPRHRPSQRQSGVVRRGPSLASTEVGARCQDRRSVISRGNEWCQVQCPGRCEGPGDSGVAGCCLVGGALTRQHIIACVADRGLVPQVHCAAVAGPDPRFSAGKASGPQAVRRGPSLASTWMGAKRTDRSSVARLRRAGYGVAGQSG